MWLRGEGCHGDSVGGVHGFFFLLPFDVSVCFYFWNEGVCGGFHYILDHNPSEVNPFVRSKRKGPKMATLRGEGRITGEYQEGLGFSALLPCSKTRSHGLLN